MNELNLIVLIEPGRVRDCLLMSHDCSCADVSMRSPAFGSGTNRNVRWSTWEDMRQKRSKPTKIHSLAMIDRLASRRHSERG